MRLVLLSDTHGRHNDISVPNGDILIHTGDFCNSGSFEDAKEFAIWLSKQPHKHKIVISGNHDIVMEKHPEVADLIFGGVAEYLLDSYTIINGLKIYGSPYQPIFGAWAFNLSDEKLKEKWQLIPDDTDILLTHCPPFRILDKVGLEHCGCKYLLEKIKEIKPFLHVFGHIHEGRGMKEYGMDTIFINCTIADGRYLFKYKPVIFDIGRTDESCNMYRDRSRIDC